MLRMITTPMVLASAALLLCGFKPFTPVKNVCPSCPVRTADTVVLTSGEKVRCTIVAQNADHYILERFGEYRAVPKSEVTSVEWRSSKEGRSQPGDQVILSEGVALHGKIMREVPGRYLIVRVGRHRHVAWLGQIEAVYKNGQRQKLQTAAPKP